MSAKLREKACYTRKREPHITHPQKSGRINLMISSQMYGVSVVYCMRVFKKKIYFIVTTLNPPFRAEDMEGLYKKVVRGYYPRIDGRYS